MSFSSQKHATQDLLYLLPLSFFFLIYGLGSGSLASWDEGVYASVAKGIFASNDWFVLRMNGELWTEKPPLAIWATALFYHLLGPNELAARLFSALCGAGCVLTTYVLGRRLFDRWTGFLGALVLLSTSDFLRWARSGMPETPFLFFLTLTLLFFWMGRGRNRYLIFSGVCLGLAFMINGFAAFLAFPVIWLYALFSDRMNVVCRSSYWIGVMIAAAIALPWHLGQLVLHRGLAGAQALSWSSFAWPFQALDAPGHLWYYYARILVNRYHPWILVAIVTGPWFFLKAVKDREEEAVFLSCWMYLVFAIVTLFHLKRDGYILPVYPALSLTVGYALARMFRERQAHFARAAFLVIMALHVPYSNVFEQDYNRDLKAMAPAVSAKLAPKETVVLYNLRESPAVSFYLERPSVYVDTPETLLEQLKIGHRYLLVRQEDMVGSALGPLLIKNRLIPFHAQGDLRLFAKKT